MISPATQIGFGFDTPLWTLTLEIGFYIVLPFIAASYFRRPLVGLAIALAIAVLWREAFHHIGDIAGWFGGDLSLHRALELQFNSINQLPNWAFSFASGMTGAWAYVRVRERYDRARVEQIAARMLIPALLLFAFFAYLVGRKAIGTDFPNGITPNLLARESTIPSIGFTASLATVMLMLAFAPVRLQTPFAHPLARKLGDISYGIYLIQAPILWFLVFHWHSLPTNGTLGSFTAWMAAGSRLPSCTDICPPASSSSRSVAGLIASAGRPRRGVSRRRNCGRRPRPEPGRPARRAVSATAVGRPVAEVPDDALPVAPRVHGLDLEARGLQQRAQASRSEAPVVAHPVLGSSWTLTRNGVETITVPPGAHSPLRLAAAFHGSGTCSRTCSQMTTSNRRSSVSGAQRSKSG